MVALISRSNAEKINELMRIGGVDEAVLLEFVKNIPGPIYVNYFGSTPRGTLLNAIENGYTIGFVKRNVSVGEFQAKQIKRQYDYAKDGYRMGVEETLLFLGLSEILEVECDDIT